MKKDLVRVGKLSALSSLFDYLCEHNAVAGNPVDGVKRPMANSGASVDNAHIAYRFGRVIPSLSMILEMRCR
jgi:hypothetical protein